MSNSNYLPRGVFNFLICALVGVAVAIFFSAASCIELIPLQNINPTVLMIGCFVAALAGAFMASSSRNTVVQIIGFTLVPIALGIMSRQWLYAVDGQVLYEAMLMTAAAVAIMAILSAMFPNFFMRISGILIISLLVIIVVSLVGLFVAGFDYTWINAISLLVFMGLLGVDFVIARNSPPTVSIAIAISVSMFLDIINILMNITSLTDD